MKESIPFLLVHGPQNRNDDIPCKGVFGMELVLNYKTQARIRSEIICRLACNQRHSFANAAISHRHTASNLRIALSLPKPFRDLLLVLVFQKAAVGNQYILQICVYAFQVDGKIIGYCVIPAVQAQEVFKILPVFGTENRVV